MKRKLALIALGLLVIMASAGCQMTPKQKLYAGWQSYKAVAVVLLKAREDGVIESDALWAKILKADSVVYQALVAYDVAVMSGRPAAAEWEAFNVALDKLMEMYQRLPEPKAKKEPMMEVF